MERIQLKKYSLILAPQPNLNLFFSSRLCEKWTFTLCPEIPFPSLEFLSSGHVHGPVPSDFVPKKIRACDRKYGKGTYLLRMSSQMHSRFHLHYLVDNEKGVLFDYIQ